MPRATTIRSGCDHCRNLPGWRKNPISCEHTYTHNTWASAAENVTLIGRGSRWALWPGAGLRTIIACPTTPQETISGNGHSGDSVITIRGAGNVTLQYLTITGGRDAADGAGGGVSITTASAWRWTPRQ